MFPFFIVNFSCNWECMIMKWRRLGRRERGKELWWWESIFMWIGVGSVNMKSERYRKLNESQTNHAEWFWNIWMNITILKRERKLYVSLLFCFSIYIIMTTNQIVIFHSSKKEGHFIHKLIFSGFKAMKWCHLATRNFS